MSTSISANTLENFATFGDLLRFLRRRAGITQMELSIAVGYSDAQISRLEQNLRLPDLPTIEARFVPALGIENEPKVVSRLLELAANLRREDAPGLGLCPYKGLNFFDEGDVDLFFGREELTAKLMEKVFALVEDGQEDHERFLAVVGASGSGKSSLIRAGLVPALRWNKRTANWPIYVLTPTAHPLESLAAGLTQDADSLLTTTVLIDDLSRDSRSLGLFLKGARKTTGVSNSLIIIDQFEELFTLCRDENERQIFIDNLLTAAAEEDGPAFVIIALRADFYANCSGYPKMRKALARDQEYIGAMSVGELRRAIEEPAHRGRWEMEPGLVDLLLHDVGHEPGALPLLSHALLETWERRRGRTMTMSGYAASGGVRGAISETAETVFVDQFTTQQQEIARRIFIRLTELGDETSTGDTRRRAMLSELILHPEEEPITRNVIQKLANARLIITSADSVEVAHEALIREWPNLREWLNEGRESLRLHRHITDAAQAWEKMNRDPGELYRGARLAQAVEWAARPENYDCLNPLEREFLHESRAFAEREKGELDALRQRELEAAQRAAESEKRRVIEQIQATKREHQRSVYLAGALLIALIMATAAAVYANRSTTLARQNAENARTANTQRAIAEGEVQARKTAEAHALWESKVAFARELVTASAYNLLDTGDPELSSLLSLYSLKLHYSQDAENALRQSLMAMRKHRVLQGHSQQVAAVDFHPDGKRLVSTGEDGEIKVWALERKDSILIIPDCKATSAIFSPEGNRIAAYCSDETARIWDAVTGEELLRVPVKIFWTSYLAFSPDGALLATPADNGVTPVWDTRSGRPIASLEGHTDSTWHAQFSPNGKHLVTLSEDGTAMVWDTASWASIQSIESEGKGFSDVSFSPDNRQLALHTGSEIIIRDYETQENLLRIPTTGFGFAFSPDGTRVGIGLPDGKVQVMDAVTGIQILSLPGGPSPQGEISFSPDGKYLASAGEAGSVIIWDISPEGSREVLSVGQPEGMVGRIAVAPDRSSFATSRYDGIVEVWDFSTGRALRKIQAHRGAVWDVDYSPDGKRLVTAGEDSLVKVWDLRTGQGLHILKGHIDAVEYSVGGFFNGVLEATFSLDGAMIASGGEDGMVKLWDASSGKLLHSLQVHPDKNGVINLRFSPDSSLLAAVSDTPQAAVTLWRVSTSAAHLVFQSTYLSEQRFIGLAISPGGGEKSSDPVVAVGDRAGVIRFLSVDNDTKVLHELADHTDTVNSIEYNQDGSLLVISSRDGTIKIRDGASGAIIKTIHPGYAPQKIALSKDGKYLFTAGADVVARVFVIQTEDLIDLAMSRLTRGFTPEECQKYLHLETCPEKWW